MKIYFGKIRPEDIDGCSDMYFEHNGQYFDFCLELGYFGDPQALVIRDGLDRILPIDESSLNELVSALLLTKKYLADYARFKNAGEVILSDMEICI